MVLMSALNQPEIGNKMEKMEKMEKNKIHFLPRNKRHQMFDYFGSLQ